MTRVLKGLSYPVAFYVVPLIGSPSSILSVEVLLLSVATFVVFITQPEIRTDEACARSSDDGSSVLGIIGATTASQIVPVVEWAYFGHSPGVPVQLAGAALLLVGILLRLFAIRNLDRYFTATVKVTRDQHVVTTGPHALVRHPSYLGALISVAGSSILLGAPMGLAIGVGLMLAAYVYRIHVEEIALLTKLGEEYRVYQRQTPHRLIPCVW